MFATLLKIYFSLVILSAVGSFAIIANVVVDRWLQIRNQRPLLEDDTPPAALDEAEETEDDTINDGFIEEAPAPPVQSQPVTKRPAQKTELDFYEDIPDMEKRAMPPPPPPPHSQNDIPPPPSPIDDTTI